MGFAIYDLRFTSRRRFHAARVNRKSPIVNPIVVLVLYSATAIGNALAQPTSPPPASPPRPDPLAQLMTSQPSIDVTSKVEATATFDPPVVRPGEKSVYRVTFNALDDSVKWPDEIVAPPQLALRLSARGQVLQPAGDRLKPQTAINHHVRASAPGSFTIPEFVVQVYGRPVIVPAARLDVVTEPAAATPPALQLDLELSETNAYAGQPVAVRVLMPASASNVVQGLQHLRLSGDGILVDQGVARQSITMMARDGRNLPTYVYETIITPLITGKITITAQGFTSGNRFGGTITIQGQVTLPGGTPQYVLLDSDPGTLNVRPVPRSGSLPGFTGAIGTFISDPPQLSTNQARVGDAVKLTITMRGEGNLARFVPPPPPRAGDWQISAAVPGGAPVPNRLPGGAAPAANGVSFAYTLIPLTNGTLMTPAIPFSYFDPNRAAYVDLAIPSVPITVAPGLAAIDSQVLAEANAASAADEPKLTLSALAVRPGRAADSLVPLQQRSWFLLVQLLPVFGLGGLWTWDRRRRYLEQHPDIVLRWRARRALRRERRALQRAVRAGDSLRFANVAVSAMRVACAPHYPAEPRALVCRDVLDLLRETEQTGRVGEVIRRFFSVADAALFSATATEINGLLSLQPELERVLDQLEARL